MNSWTHGWMVPHATIELYAEASRAEDIAAAIVEAAHTGVAGDGTVAILPVEKLYWIRAKAEATPEEILPVASPLEGSTLPSHVTEKGRSRKAEGVLALPVRIYTHPE